MTRPWIRRLAVVAMVLTMLATGCATRSATPVGGSPIAVTAVDAECVWLATAVDAGGPRLSIVVDNTGSHRSIEPPPEALETIAAVAQQAGTVSIVRVDGAGVAAPVVWARQPMMPADARGTPREPAVLALGVECALRAGGAAPPARPGSDIVSAINAAVDTLGPRHDGDRLIVLTDGYASAGPLRFDEGIDIGDSSPAQVAAGVVDRGLLVDLGGLEVAVVLGDLKGPPAAEYVRRWMEAVYRELCRQGGAATCTVQRHSGTAGSPVRGVPADPVELPPVAPPIVEPPAEPGLSRLAASEFFEPGSPDLQPGAETALRPLAARLGFGGDGEAEIVGHVASWGPESYREQLSERRAIAIFDVLVALGADPAQMRTRGAGSREPVVDDTGPDGELLPGPAARNRRVDVLVTSRP